MVKAHRPKVAICPHQEDYCDTYARRKVDITGKQISINHLLQSGSADPNEIKALEDEIAALKHVIDKRLRKAMSIM